MTILAPQIMANRIAPKISIGAGSMATDRLWIERTAETNEVMGQAV
jgi:hypothetical protein